MKFLNFDKVLCIGAHPDDVEYGMVGSMYKFTNTQFDVLILSEGGDFDESTGKKRQLECEKIWNDIPNVSGKFTDVETLFATKKFLESLGSNYYDCRYDNVQFKEDNRESYLFNSSINIKVQLC